VPALLAVQADELTGPQVRRLTRRSIRHRADTTFLARLEDTWTAVVSVGIGLAVAGGWLESLRRSISTEPPAAGTSLPAALTTAVLVVVALAVVVSLFARLGPVGVGSAAVAWWLPLPAPRRGVLRGELVRLTVVCTGVATVLAVPLTFALTDRPRPLLVVSSALVAVATVVGLLGAVTLLQTRKRTGVLAPAAGALAVLLSATAAGLAAVPELVDGVRGLPAWSAPAGGALAAGAAVAVALLLLAAAERGLGRLDAGSLRAVGATSEYAAASAVSMDTRELGRALAARRLRPPGRSRRFASVSRPWQAIVAGDLVLLSRSPWQAGQLVVATAIPVLAARTDGINRLPLAVWAGLAVGWLSAAVATGSAARHAQAAPALDRLLPLSPAALMAARAVTPALLLTAACGIGGLLIGAGTDSPLSWAALALATVPAWTAAALRGAYRPELNWSGPVVSSPMGVLPVGVGATLVQGIDVGLAGSAPLAVALVLGGPPSPTLIGIALGWACCLAAAAFVHLTRRKPAGG
jgi:hypothetical protein